MDRVFFLRPIETKSFPGVFPNQRESNFFPLKSKMVTFVFDQRGKVIIFNGLIRRLTAVKIKLVRF